MSWLAEADPDGIFLDGFTESKRSSVFHRYNDIQKGYVHVQREADHSIGEWQAALDEVAG